MNEKLRAQRQQRWANVRGVYWPDLSTPEGLKSASSYSWGVALFLAFSYAAVFALGYVYGWAPGAGDLDAAALSANLVIDACAVVVALVLAWFAWRRRSRIAAVLVLAWIATEAVLKIALVGAAGIVLSLILVLLAIGGVRAAFYKHRFAAGAASVRTSA
jgi:hypothetical protein